MRLRSTYLVENARIVIRTISVLCVALLQQTLTNDNIIRQAATRAECRRSCGQRYRQVRPWLVETLTYRTTLAQCTVAGRVQPRPHGVQLSAQPSTPVPRRPLPVCIQCHFQTTPSLCQLRSSRRASLSSQQLRSAGFFCGRPCDMELVTRQYERPSHQTPSDVH